MGRLASIAAVIATAGGLFCGSASAATIVVNSTDDAGPGSGGDTGCTLRDAVQAANTNAHAGGLGGLGCDGDTAGADTIVLQGGLTYHLEAFTDDDTNIWGDLDIEGPVTIVGTGGGLATIAGDDSGDKDRVIHVEAAAGSVRLERIKVTDGSLDGGTGTGGGGIYAQAPLSVVDSEVAGNHVALPSVGALGGGVYVAGPLGKLTMTRSTVAGNTMQATNQQVIGAGVAVYGAGSAVSIENSTISGNTSTGSGVAPGLVGGAFLGDSTANAPSPVSLTHTTITTNTATQGGALTGGLQIPGGGTMTGNLVAANTADNDPQDCFGFPGVSSTGNLLGEAEIWCELSEPGNLRGTPASPIVANLGPLVDNGGLTRTHTLNPGSPAIDLGGPCPELDQRGLYRYAGGACDAGAVEIGAAATPPPAGGAPPQTTPPQPTGKRAAALKTCKKKKPKRKRKKCRKRARRLPV